MELSINQFFNIITNTLVNVARVEENKIKLKELVNSEEYSILNVRLVIEDTKSLDIYISYERNKKYENWLTIKGGYSTLYGTIDNPLWCITSYSAEIVNVTDTLLHRVLYGVEINEKELEEVIL